ncbi:ER oxidoreductin [Starmerella bacillaris]|uniref:ER oxidoreductin n=1 Tax=Starmerella bacillaris TaxID=1247836 RepID=A0AAV5RLT5_STABA|nr:ER oxidoreductin [Starmerella bacillaris]
MIWPVLLALTVSASESSTEEPVLKGRWRSLPVSAPENQLLLHLEDRKIGDTNGTIGSALTQNRKIFDELEDLLQTPYFSTYKVDLSDKKCPLEDDGAQCANSQCAIEPLSFGDIDEKLFQSQFLGRLRKDSVHSEAPEGQDDSSYDQSLYHKDACSDVNYCFPEDESVDSEGVWVDLRGNAERFTGYQGPSARNMWGMLYAENCFSYNGDEDATKNNEKKENIVEDLAGIMARPAKREMDAWPDIDTQLDLPNDCIEQRLFYRLLSGLHASISTHLCYNWWNATSEQWEAVLPDWLERVGWFEDRVNNMFFDYALMSRAIYKLIDGYGSELVYSASSNTIDNEVRDALSRLGNDLRSSPLADAIDEQGLYKMPGTAALKTELRQRVRNVNMLMSCVGCERCRLWGKIQTAGYGTALKILLEFPEKASDDPELTKSLLKSFRRSELVALMNTFGRISNSVHAADVFKSQAEEEIKEQKKTPIDTTSWAFQWRLAIDDTKEALRFIFSSYINFPKSFARQVLFYSTYYWDILVNGRSKEPANVAFSVKSDL